MKVAANGARSLSLLRQRQQRRLSDQIDLVEDEQLRLPDLGEAARGSPRPPRRCRASASISSADDVGVLRAAPGRRHHGAVEPALAARKCPACRRRRSAPCRRSRCRATARAWSAPCGVTIATLVPTSALTSVDLPALGAPIRATKPQRVPSPAGRLSHRARSGLTPSRVSMAAAAACSAARLERPSLPPGASRAARRRRGTRGSWSGPVRSISR